MPASTNQSASSDLLLLIGRIMVSALFLIAAYGKIKGYSFMSGYFEKLGIPFPQISTPLIIAGELIMGLCMLTGFMTRCAALAMGAFCIVSAYIAHMNFADPSQFNHFLKNVAIAGALLAFFVSGPGRYSIDRRKG